MTANRKDQALYHQHKCYLHTARNLSVARLIVRNVVQDIKIFFSGYLNFIIHYYSINMNEYLTSNYFVKKIWNFSFYPQTA